MNKYNKKREKKKKNNKKETVRIRTIPDLIPIGENQA